MQTNIFKHVKRGTIYEALEIVYDVDINYKEGDIFTLGTPFGEIECQIQCSTKPEASLVIYKPLGESFTFYARPETEFFDGRFIEWECPHVDDEELLAQLEQLRAG